jgi:hypothetical protein
LRTPFVGFFQMNFGLYCAFYGYLGHFPAPFLPSQDVNVLSAFNLRLKVFQLNLLNSPNGGSAVTTPSAYTLN